MEINAETKKILSEHYGTRDEGARLKSKHGSVEFLTTMKYVEKYLKPGDKIIEIGAGTGRYSLALAKMGYTVDAVELVESNVEIIKNNATPGEEINITQGDALDLSAFDDEAYDITLLLGPLYHLFTEKDKKRALGEALRVTKKGGIIFAAYIISDASILFNGFKRNAYNIAEFIEKGYIDPATFAARSEPALIFELVRKEDIDRLIANLPVKRLHYVASDGCSADLGEELDAMDDAAFELYLRYHFAVCERADMAGMTAHSLDVLKKL